jgi:hypothetical protein
MSTGEKAADGLTETGFVEGTPTRPPIDPQQLKGMSAACAVVAFSSVGWIMRTFKCTEAQAREFKLNAQYDFENMLAAARRAKGGR